jgi:uncharacterized protein YxeA
MKTPTKKGEVTLAVVAVIAVIGLAVLWFKPTVQESNAQRVEEVTQSIETNDDAIDSKVSASINQIGVANALAPDSPSKTFIGKEVVLITPALPSPSMEDLLEAERRRVAVMEGRIAEANKLYGEAQVDISELIAEKAVLKDDLQKLKNDLYKQAGAADFLKKITIIIGLIAAIVTALFIWVRIQSGKVYGGLREFISYNKNERVLGELREAFDTDIKRRLGL